MLGAKDVAFPRLNLASYYIYVAGALLRDRRPWSPAASTPAGPSTRPTRTTTDGSVGLMTLGGVHPRFSSIFTGLNFIATIHKLRAPGMTLVPDAALRLGHLRHRLIQVLATPVLGITLLLLIIERVFSIGIFDPQLGGDPVLFQHFFWFYSHPAVYIMILPGMAHHQRGHPASSRARRSSATRPSPTPASPSPSSASWCGATTCSSAGSRNSPTSIFSFLTFLVAIPSGVKVFNWLATMYKGSISLEAPMLYAHHRSSSCSPSAG